MFAAWLCKYVEIKDSKLAKEMSTKNINLYLEMGFSDQFIVFDKNVDCKKKLLRKKTLNRIIILFFISHVFH